jgi:hypothetical protein
LELLEAAFQSLPLAAFSDVSGILGSQGFQVLAYQPGQCGVALDGDFP